jgi:phosphatidylinositol-3-phosphatase
LRGFRTLALLVSLAVVAGCGAGLPARSIAPSPSETPGPTAAPTPTATPMLSPTGTPTGTPTPTPTAAGRPIPDFAHIYVIVLENREYGSIVGNPDAPYLNGLVDTGGLATNFHGVTHPSLPNYLALFAGTTFGIRDDGTHDIDARSLADQLEDHGRTWRVYAQNVPSSCSTVATASGGIDLVGAAGVYARKHEPAISFTGISRDSSRCARIDRLAAFDPVAADFELIVPNMTNDMHDGSIAQGDAFLRAFVPRIMDSAQFANSVLVVTFDEGTTDSGGGGRIATVLVSPRVAAGTRSGVEHDHYSLLRTVENAWSLGCLANSCDANDLRELFGG